MANWTDEAKEKARETRRANKAAKAAAAAAREAELQSLREEVERLRAGTPTVVRTVLKDRAAVISDYKGLLTDKAAQLFKASADNITLSKGLSAARDEIGDLMMIVADRDAQIARLRLESDEMQDELDAASIYAGELKEKLDRRSPAGGISASTVTMAINILRTASDTLALALEDDGWTEDDDTQNPARPMNKPRTQRSAPETVGIDSLERVRETEDDKTVLQRQRILATVLDSVELTPAQEKMVEAGAQYLKRRLSFSATLHTCEIEEDAAVASSSSEIPIAEPEDKAFLEAAMEAADKAFLEAAMEAEDDDTQNPARPMNRPRTQWSATEIVGIGIDNPERVRKTEDGKTVLMPTTYTIKSSPKVTKEDLINGDPIYPFSTRPVDVSNMVKLLEVEAEDERARTAIPVEALVEAEDQRVLDELEKIDGVALVSGEVSFCKECERPSNSPHNIHCSLQAAPRAEEGLNSHPYLVPPPPLEQRTMLELNRLAIELGISPSGNKPHLVRLLNEAAGKEKQ